jgi:hypothetical protein
VEAHQVKAGYSPLAEQAGPRALANLALAMLVLNAARTGDSVWPGRAYQRFKDAGNMSDRLGAISALVNAHSPLADAALERFHALAGGDALVLDKWFALQARAAEAVPEVHGTQAVPFHHRTHGRHRQRAQHGQHGQGNDEFDQGQSAQAQPGGRLFGLRRAGGWARHHHRFQQRRCGPRRAKPWFTSSVSSGQALSRSCGLPTLGRAVAR